MNPASVRVKSPGTKHIRHLSAGSRRLLSVILLGGLCFFALLSFTAFFKEPQLDKLDRHDGVRKADPRGRRMVSGRRTGTRHSEGRALGSLKDGHTRTGRHAKQRRSSLGDSSALSRRGAATVVSGGLSSTGAQPGAGEPLRLLLASHGRLIWYYPDTNETKVLHDGRGVHYGVFPGERDHSGKLRSVWNVVRPHNWHPKSSEEHLIQLDAETGKELSRVKLESRFTHDVVRSGSRVFVCNTEGGEIQQLAYPSMNKVRSMQLFTLKEHINTLAPLEQDKLWVVLHNLGKSKAVQLDLSNGPSAQAREVKRLEDVGTKSHGLVDLGGRARAQLRLGAGAGGQQGAGPFVMLDSDGSSLVVVDPASGAMERVYTVPKDDAGPRFLKGLSVVGGIAYFGISIFAPRAARADASRNSELAAVHLASGTLLWRRTVSTRGLLNVVAAPHLGEDSTYRAVQGPVPQHAAEVIAQELRAAGREDDAVAVEADAATLLGSRAAGASSLSASVVYSGSGTGGAEEGDGYVQYDDRSVQLQGKGVSKRASMAVGDTAAWQLGSAYKGIDDAKVKAATQKLLALGYKPKVGGHWSSDQPYLDLGSKTSAKPWEAGIQLPLMQVDISKLQRKILSMPEEMWSRDEQRKNNAVIDGRSGNMAQFKPGVEALYLVFSDQSTEHVYRFPYYNYFREELEDLLEQVVGKGDMGKVVRMQFARMKPGSQIKLHKDMGGYAKFAHRIHVPVVTHGDVSFQVCAELDRKRRPSRDAQVPHDDPDCTPIPMAEGMVFELNNRVTHRVFNPSPVKRVQLVVDVVESPRAPRMLKPGAACNYVRAVMVCPESAIES